MNAFAWGFGVQTYGVHNVTETLEVDVLVDANADGIYTGDPLGIQADYMVVKLAAPDSTTGEVCVFDLSLPDPFDDCVEACTGSFWGFWDGPACDSGSPVTVDVGSAGPDTDPGILALFPNNVPSHDPAVVETDN